MKTGTQREIISSSTCLGGLKSRTRGIPFVLLFACAAAWLTGAASAQLPSQFPLAPGGGAAQPASHVKARLISDVAKIHAGETFRVGVLYKIDPQWHVYWRYGGDVGLPTQVRWTLPEGFQVGSLQWPAPERIEQAGLVSYGYEDEVLLYATVQAPAGLDSARGSVKIAAQSEWLVCQETCIPGEAALELTLPLDRLPPNATTGREPSADAAIFERFEHLIPPAPGPSGASADVNIEAAPSELHLAPGESGIFTLTIKPQGLFRFGQNGAAEPVSDGWRIDTQEVKANVSSTGLFPFAPDDWQISIPSLKNAEPTGLVYTLSVSPRAGVASTGEHPELVARIPLVHPASGQRKQVMAALVLPVTVVGQASASQTTTASLARSQSEPTTASASGLSFVTAKPSGLPLWLSLIFAFLGGIILNVMPCVLPVLSLKILGFVKQSGEDPRRVMRLGWAFTLGVLVSFTALWAVVVALKAAGNQVGWGFQFQEPRFVIVMAAVIFAFALSLFGVFSFELSSRTMTRLEAAGGREGYPGAFMNGVLATALATPCMAPMLGSALAFAFSQSAAVILAVFLAIGAGLAMPYLLLSANPGWLRVLPRPGPWMETFKQTMGLALMATLVWLLWVLGSQVGYEGIIWTLAYLLVLGAGAWLFEKTKAPKVGALRRRTMLAAALILALGGYFAFPEHYLKMVQTSGEQIMANPIEPTGAPGEIAWEPFSVERTEELVREGRMVFIDFTANWCTTCKYNEATALASGRVAKAFARHQVAALKADWSRRDKTIGNVLAQFGRVGVPLYVILPPGRASQPVILPTVLTPGKVEEMLGKAAGTKS